MTKEAEPPPFGEKGAETGKQTEKDARCNSEV